MPFEKMPGDVPIFGPGAPPAPTAPSKSGRWQPLPAEDVELHGPPGAPKQQPTWGESGVDAAKTVAPGAARGVAMGVGTRFGGDLPYMAEQGWGRIIGHYGAKTAAEIGLKFGYFKNQKEADDAVASLDAASKEEMGNTKYGLPTSKGLINAGETVTGGPWYQPKTGLGKFVNETAELAGASAAGGGSGDAAALALRGRGTLGNVAKQATLDVATRGAPAAAAGYAVDQIIPEGNPWHDPLRQFAQIGAGAAGVGAEMAAGRAAQGARDLIGSKSWRDEQAARTLYEDALDPNNLASKIHGAQDEIVPGSYQTMGHMTGDEGILRSQQAYSDVSRERQAQASARLREQDQARSQFADQAAPDNVDRMDVVRGVQNHLDGIEQAYEAQTNAARQQAIKDATDAVGAAPRDPVSIGNDMRKGMRSDLDQTKAKETAFWNAIDPENKYTVSTQPLHGAAEGVYGRLTPTDRDTVTDRERTILNRLNTYGDQLSFGETLAYKRMLGDALERARKDGYATAESKRIAALYQQAKDALSKGVGQHVANEAEAVRAGQMSPEATIEARVRAWQDDFQARRAAEQAGADPAAGAGRNAVPGVGGVRGFRGNEGAPGGGSGGGPNVPGMAGMAGRGSTPMDAAARARLIRANDATKDRIERFRDPSQVADSLATGAGGDYSVRSSALPDMHWKSGNEGGQYVDDYFRAGGDKQALLDAAFASMHKRGVINDGAFDPTKYQAWRNAHRTALSRLERRAPGTTQQFENANSAATAYAQAGMRQKLGMKALNDSVMGNIRKVTTEADVPTAIGGLLKPGKAGEMERLYGAIQGNKDAVGALHRSIIDHITQRYMNGKGSFRNDSFARFVRDSEPNLQKAGMKPAQINVLKRIAKDWEVNSRTWSTGTNSNTAARQLPFSQRAPAKNTMFHTAAHLITNFSLFSQNWVGTAVGAGFDRLISKYEDRLRANGVKVDDLVWAAMNDPKNVGLPLLQKYPVNASKAQQEAFKNKLHRALLLVAVEANRGH